MAADDGGFGAWMSTALELDPVGRVELHTDRPQSARMYDYLLAHTRALLNSTPDGRIDFVAADLRDPKAVLAHPCLSGPDAALDLDRPVALVLSAVVHFLADEDDPHGIVATLVDRLAPGSWLVLTHATADASPDQVGRAGSAYRSGGVGIHPRSLEEVTAFAAGLDIAAPGVVHPGAWRPTPGAPVSATTPDGYVFAARKP